MQDVKGVKNVTGYDGQEPRLTDDMFSRSLSLDHIHTGIVETETSD